MLTTKKLNNEDLLNVYKLLKEGRISLIESYIDINDYRYRKTLQYRKSQEALKIVIDLLDNKWVDEQITLNKKRYNNKEISIDCFLKIVLVFKRYLSKNQVKDFCIESFVLNNKSKIKILENMLEVKKEMDHKTELLLFDYLRDELLFEREMEKFEKEINETML